MEKTTETYTKIDLSDPFGIDNDIFSSEEKTSEESEVSSDVIGEETPAENQVVFNDKDIFAEDETAEEVADTTKEVDNKKEDPKESVEISPELQLQGAIGGVRFLAQLKGIEEQIDFDNIESLEDVEDLLESFGNLDELVATEKLKQKSETIAKITDFISKGGDEKEILAHLSKTEEISELDITTESGAKSLIKEYYKNVVKYPDELINKKIKKLEEGDSLVSEAEDLQPLYQEHLNKELDKKTKNLEEVSKKNLILVQQKKESFIQSLQANKYNRETATELFNTAFQEVVMTTGEKKILLDAKIDKLKENPEGFLKLVSFVNNPLQYEKQILANKGSQIVQENTKKRLIINSKPKETSTPTVQKERKFQLNFS